MGLCKNTVVSWCENFAERHNFTRNFAETVPFRKIFTRKLGEITVFYAL